MSVLNEKQLLEKWESIPSSLNVSNIEDPYVKLNTARMMENQVDDEAYNSLEENFTQSLATSNLNYGSYDSGDGNFEPIKIKDMHSRATDYLMLIEYQNADGEPLLVQVLYNSDTDSLISVYAEKLDTRESKLEPYMDYSEYKESEIQTYDFTWNGKSFQCSVAGLVVCFSYCLGWNIVGPVAGGVCDIACGLAFAAMCAAA